MAQVWRRGAFEISTERARLDIRLIHEELSERSYWAQGRALSSVARSIEHSLPFGVYTQGRQVGFARVVTDYATFAWLADVFVLAEFRGQGLGKWLLEVIVTHPELQGLRRWVLATKDAHELYRRYGFAELAQPERWMEWFEPQLQGATGTRAEAATLAREATKTSGADGAESESRV
jgi:GNAT superfamily N-acetyltransferase